MKSISNANTYNVCPTFCIADDELFRSVDIKTGATTHLYLLWDLNWNDKHYLGVLVNY